MSFQLFLPEKKTALDLVFAANAVAVLISGDRSSFTFTANSGTDTITAVSHDYVNGTPIKISNSGGVVPAPLEENKTYYVVNAATNTFQISETIGGTAIDLTSNGSGTNTAIEDTLVNTLLTHSSGLVPIWVRHEVAGINRIAINWSAAVISSPNAAIPAAEVTISPSSPVNYRYLFLIRGGSVTTGNTAGEGWGVIDDGEQTLGLDGKIFTISPQL